MDHGVDPATDKQTVLSLLLGPIFEVSLKSLFTQYSTILWVLAPPVFYVISRYKYNLFHSLADGASIVIAACAFTIIWNSRSRLDNNYYLFTGIGFLFFAVLDLMHLLGNKNMGVFPEYGNLGPAFYIASRYLLSVSFVIAPFFINRKLNAPLVFAAYSAITLFIVLSVLYWKIFPVCIIEGVGLTPFKVISDYIICLILVAAIVLLLVHRRSFDVRVLRIIVYSIILSIATGLTFTLYADPFGITNMAGHFFQIASFYLVYVAFIETSLTKPQEIMFQALQQSKEELAENLRQLEYANDELKERTNQLENANKDLESFSYSVSHDLRAPLRAIEAYSRLLVKECYDQLEEDSRGKLDRIRGKTKEMNDMIEGILAFSRLGSRKLARQIIDMEDLATKAWHDISSIHPATDISMNIARLPAAYGDPALLGHVFSNLFSNAVKFTTGKEPAMIAVGCRENGNERVYYVKDNGIGFDMEYKGRLFGAFQRLHAGEKFEGTGVGLSIVKRIIERHGGHIWAEGAINEGATFYFTLPEKIQ